MFTGIIEVTGQIVHIECMGTNKNFTIESVISDQLKVDQSVSHNGVCLTVISSISGQHKVTAIAETLEKTTLGDWKLNTLVNLERCLQMNGRLDGHLVQGHIDCTAICIEAKDMNGSWNFRFRFDENFAALIVEKGSICINGVSLTIFNLKKAEFTVAIIPYTFEHTNIKHLRMGKIVNVEFDVIGKYVNRINSLSI